VPIAHHYGGDSMNDYSYIFQEPCAARRQRASPDGCPRQTRRMGGGGVRKEREATAYHEAGHAVACVVLRLPVVSVDIVPQEDRLGYCRFDRPDPDGAPTWQRDHFLRDHLTIILAGPAAEIRRFPGHRWCIFLGDSDDIACARTEHQALHETNPQMAGEDWDDWFRVAQGLVKDEWQAITAVATALLERGELTGEEVKQIIGGGGTP